ncbi:MAG TPA: hypothetical protein DDX19_01820 [Rhodopirellula baltica]|uniref:Uncharacterized protein n=2 Tax=Rhodopirellula baltica TaxID=265606 RepID=F2AW31_RHOBT|nr:hypothetical protein RBWH47_05272 [Rhodopirellula baltica WH47]EKK01470.1 hypothetical protein RBSH_03216 [Rhodopirellula baltica SH28]HBE61517.1 hypothetical protein [Rhodopirellula baltica]
MASGLQKRQDTKPSTIPIGIQQISGEVIWGVFVDYFGWSEFSGKNFEVPLKFALPRTGANM